MQDKTTGVFAQRQALFMGKDRYNQRACDLKSHEYNRKWPGTS
ncbi:hypothetical protein [Entomohabitans teleogrylli]|nr:hypothetical protein [Entomohabitans teleogrylli]